MGLWRFLFGKPIKITDAFFGELLFMEVKSDPSQSYFEGWRHFEPTDEDIEVGVNGNLEGPTQIQKVFFKQVENDYASIIQRVILMVESVLQEWQVNFRISDFEQDFKPVYLFIPSCEEKPIQWEIAFESMPGLVKDNYPYILSIEMADYEPQHVSVSQ